MTVHQNIHLPGLSDAEIIRHFTNSNSPVVQELCRRLSEQLYGIGSPVVPTPVKTPPLICRECNAALDLVYDELEDRIDYL